MDPLTDAEKDALALLAENHRLLVVVVPAEVPDRFVAQLTTWSNLALDLRLMPPLPIPATAGQVLGCPYCGSVASTDITIHSPGCKYRKAMERWYAGQVKIDEEFPKGGMPSTT